MSCVVNGIATLKCIPIFLSNIINAAAILSGVSAIFLIVWAGIRFISSGGDPIRVAQARATVTYAIIGLVIIGLSFVLVKVFANITGTQCVFIGVSC